MKNLIFTIILLTVSFCLELNAQENFLYHDLNEAKKQNVVFQDISAAFTVSKVSEVKASEKSFQNFRNADEVGVFYYTPSKNAQLGKAISFPISVKNTTYILELLEVSSTYEVETSDGEKFPANKEIKHYRGIAKDHSNSLVALTIYKDEIMGVVCVDNENFNISKAKSSDSHIIFSDKNMTSSFDFQCGTPDHSENDDFSGYDAGILLQNFSASEVVSDRLHASSAGNSSKYVRFYIETEYDIYQRHGYNYTSVEVYVSNVMNTVSALYTNENIIIGLSTIYIWVNNDPYTALDAGGLLLQYQQRKTSLYNGDLGMLWTKRFTGGVAAGTRNALCDSNVANRLAICGMAFSGNGGIPTPVYSFEPFLVTHESGHLFGSRHTHACVWNGNNTAIDGCASVEGFCFPIGLPPAGTGTIMSYCNNHSSVGINFTLGFGQQPGNVIRNNYNNAGCLQPIPPISSFSFSNYNQSGVNISPCPNEYLYIYPDFPIGVSNILQGEWRVSGCALQSSSSTQCYIRCPSGIHSTFNVQYRFRTIHGWSNWTTLYGYNRDCASGEEPYKMVSSNYVATPNPVNSILKVTFNKEAVFLNNMYTIYLYSDKGVIVNKATSNGEIVEFNVANLSDGIYFLHVLNNNSQPEVKKIIVKH